MSDDPSNSPEPKRGPGRPKAEKPVAAARPRPSDELVKRRAERKKRGVTDHGFDKRLALDETRLDKDNFVYRQVRDDPGRVARLKNLEYEVVTPEEIGGQDVTRHGGTDREGKPLQAVLMKKFKPWHDEDQAEKLRAGKEQDAALMRGKAKEVLTEGGQGGFDYAPPTNSLSTVGVQVSRSDKAAGEYNP